MPLAIMTLEEANKVIDDHWRQIRQPLKEEGSNNFLDAIYTLQHYANKSGERND